MSRHGEILAAFGGEERTFRLGLGQVRALQEKCDAGPSELARRLAPMFQLAGMPKPDPSLPEAEQRAQSQAAMLRALMGGAFGSWRIDDYRETILQALIGGGLGHTDATILVGRYVDTAPPLESAALALKILLAWLLGPEDEPVGESPRPAKPARKSRSRAASSASPSSMPPAP